MQYTMVAMGQGEHYTRIPDPITRFNVISLSHLAGKFIITHATLQDLIDYSSGVCQAIEIQPEFHNLEENPPLRFTINKSCQWNGGTSEELSVWLAWYDGNPENPFFLDADFFKRQPEYYELHREQLVVSSFEPGGLATIEGFCDAETTVQEILEALK